MSFIDGAINIRCQHQPPFSSEQDCNVKEQQQQFDCFTSGAAYWLFKRRTAECTEPRWVDFQLLLCPQSEQREWGIATAMLWALTRPQAFGFCTEASNRRNRSGAVREWFLHLMNLNLNTTVGIELNSKEATVIKICVRSISTTMQLGVTALYKRFIDIYTSPCRS